MSKNNLDKVSKYLSLLLRHKPEVANLTMDKEGWVSVQQLLSNMETKISFEELEEIVETNNKKRFALNEDKTKIRANQGHSDSLNLELNLKTIIPPAVLYHGTAADRVDSIKKTGINKGARQHVHLSSDKDVAISVGKRHGAPVVLTIDAEKMHKDGIIFYISENRVYLTDFVHSNYIL